MKIELQFNEEIYKKQIELLYKIGYGRKRKYLNNSNYLGIIFVFLGTIAVLGNGNIGYLFILIGLYNLIAYYNFYFKLKKINRNVEAEKLNTIREFSKNPRVVFEFNHDDFIYSDYKTNLKVNWDEFLTFFEKNENIFLMSKSFQPFIFGKSEVGNEMYHEIINFVETKMKRLPHNNLF